MSSPLFADDILFFQRLLRADGLYLDALDGDWGPRTEAAQQRFEHESLRIAQEAGTFDTRSEHHLPFLSLKTQRAARLFMGRLRDAGLVARIISGTRTYAEQNRLYRQGRFGNPGPVVTRARGGESNHNFGLAWDIGLFAADGHYLRNGPEYDAAARAGLSSELEWGGAWRTFVDKPHYQIAVPLQIADLRGMFESGTATDYYV